MGFGPVRSGNRLKVRALSRARVGSAEAGGRRDFRLKTFFTAADAFSINENIPANGLAKP
jgi:hypothetical protein